MIPHVLKGGKSNLQIGNTTQEMLKESDLTNITPEQINGNNGSAGMNTGGNSSTGTGPVKDTGSVIR
jgi:hypothetical protein